MNTDSGLRRAYYVTMITSQDGKIPPEQPPVKDTDEVDLDWMSREMAERPPDPILDVDQLSDQ